MRERSLQISYRRGRAYAAYYYLDSSSGREYARSEQKEDGLVVDFDRDGRPMGVEITAPSLFTVEVMNKVLVAIGEETVDPIEVGPLQAA